MDTKQLDTLFFIAISISVPLCILIPILDIIFSLPPVVLYTLLPFGIILALIAVVASVLRIR
ncbi:hypothetical protein [Alkalibacillus haloalkaliphilus]|uniref:Uncharacterized protein n=1 Tax=Alkalibacillus haloalkaliphilus TaxID=94136 RepID=A0A511W369_9BACI|nr:hypothetical protein [Alkalibacillus haloalkaliphilus]GEN45397.1 hypothetical protein AHA02nite_11730 [Alkalibacillus haloalkaliphilus]